MHYLEPSEGNGDEMHKYSFNDSKNSINNSENNILYSNNLKKNNSFKLNNLIHNNNDINENSDHNNNDCLMNNSLVSIKDLDDIFFQEQNVSVKSKNKKEGNNNIKYKEKESKNKIKEKKDKKIEDNKININESGLENNKVEEKGENEKIKNNKEIKNKEENKIEEKNKENKGDSKNKEIVDDSKNINYLENNNKDDKIEEFENKELKIEDSANLKKEEIEKQENPLKNENIKDNNNDNDINKKESNNLKDLEDNKKVDKLKENNSNEKENVENSIKEKNNSVNNIKIRMIKLNNDEIYKEIKSNLYTYSPSLKNKKIKLSQRNCISLNNSFKKAKEIKRYKNNSMKYYLKKANKKKKLKLSSQFEDLNENNSSIDQEDKKLKNLIDIINQKKIKALKVSKDSFSIKRKIIAPLLLEKLKKQKNNGDNIEKEKLPFLLENRIQHQNDFFLQKQKCYNVKKIAYFPSNKIQINGRKSLQYIRQERKIKDNYFSSSNLISSSNSRYTNTNQKYIYNSTNNKYTNSNGKKWDKNSYLRLKNDRKIKILYDLYCRRPDSFKSKIPRIKSAFSVNENKHKFDCDKNRKDSGIIKYNLNFNNNKNDIYNNKKNWLFRLIKLKKVANIYHYDKHFGNSESCPLCQEMDKKNEESILKKGINPIVPDTKKNESKQSTRHRRIYSAITKYKGKQIKNDASKSNINAENEKDGNKSRNFLTNKSGTNSIKDNEKKCKNKVRIVNVFEKKLKWKKEIYNNKDNILNFTNNNY